MTCFKYLCKCTIIPMLIIGLMVAFAGCSKEESSPASQPAGKAEHYTLRGVIVLLPKAGEPGSQFFVRHEPVKDFRDEKGKVVGMSEMTMSFELESSALLDGLAVGDKIQADWLVQWEPKVKSVITGIKKLPADAQMNFAPPASQPVHDMSTMPGMTH